MARRHVAQKREILPDPVYKEEVITKFINSMMIDGKKAAAEKAFYGAMEEIKATGVDPVETFKTALDNAKPLLEVKSRRVGGSNYQVPIEIRPERRQALALRWLIEFARKRSGKSMVERLAGELLDAANKRGATIKRREDVHKMAEANKAFAHYRW
ncbi:MAG: 30S ribosomal protein S7 [Proteobacteria bacterium]|jgi:small subunit ribosomal protein S7|nr:MAG: 30S ribosomal protein S7 [Pseudomonadota bacterium]